jgi:hypothetical protein
MLKLVEYNSRDYVWVRIDQIELLQPSQGNTTNIRLIPEKITKMMTEALS